MKRVHKILVDMRPALIQDNAKPLAARIMQIKECGTRLVRLAIFLSDLTLLHYYLFNYCNEKTFSIENQIQEFFETCPCPKIWNFTERA